MAAQVDFVCCPLVETKKYPDGVNVVLVKGAIANEKHLEVIRNVRVQLRLPISFSDCAAAGNVTALRNPLGRAEPVLQRCYIEAVDRCSQIPTEAGIVRPLPNRVTSIHTVVPVVVYLPGCPPIAFEPL